MKLGRAKKWMRLAGAACLVAVSIASPGATARPAKAGAAPTSPVPTVPKARPMNMIFVLVDDLRYDMLGFLQRGVKTPNIDFLARNGVYFRNAVVTSSLCSPSRATILTGQSVRNHGVVDNTNSTEKGLVFFPSYLQQAGYQTAFFGKWHMGYDDDAPRPGFDHWVSFKGQGTYLPTDNLSPAQVAAGVRQTLNVDGKRINRTGYITDELTDYAMDWLQNGRDKRRPFFLYLSHKAVHSDAVPAERHKTQYTDLKINLPASMANTPENNAGKPMWVQNQRNSWHGVDYPSGTDRPITEQVRDIYRTLSAVDESLGRIVTYLKKNGLERETMVVFYSDNGYLIGDHGLIDKRNAYEPSIRVPMIAYAPGVFAKGATNDAVVRNLDLAPAFLDAAGIAKPPQMEGRSWLPLARGEVPAGKWSAGDLIYEYYWDWTTPQTPTTFAIERDRIKYIQYQGVWDTEEIYDLRKDPDEMHNLVDDPAYFETKRTLRAALFAQIADVNGRRSVPLTERSSSGLVYRNANGPHAADFPAGWYRAPNLPGRMNDMFPDTAAKNAANAEGRSYRPSGPVATAAAK
jgi:arylsulfatase A-like enzyme